MSVQLKAINQQVIFITGATSGNGLATVRMAVDKGAKVFMVARHEEELQKIQDEMRANNHYTAYAVADVAEIDQLQIAADHCIRTFGTIDTWVNNAGFSVYARLLDTTEEEARRIFDTNFWGVVNGSKVATSILRKTGGALINIGSVLSEVSLPIQGIYSASKHAVKGYTDSLRRELLADKAPVSVTLIMPAAVDTPYTTNAKSHIGEPVHTPPVYHPDVVAKMILKCAEKPIRELGVGSSAYIFPFFDRLFPKIQDEIMARKYMEKDQSKGPKSSFKVLPGEGEVSGNYEGHVMKSSVVSEAASYPWLTRALVASGLALVFLKKKRLI